MSVPSQGLVAPQALAAVLADPGVFVLDCRAGPNGAGRAAFEQGHVPGAAHTDYAADGWRVKVNGAPGLMPDLAEVAAKLGRLGIEPYHRLVICPAGLGVVDCAAAARIAWTARMAGHRSVAILDGGYNGWRSAGLPVATGAPLPRLPSTYPLAAPTALRTTTADVLAVLAAPGAALLDSRAEAYFQGWDKAPESRIGGHIPGSLNIDYVDAYDDKANRLVPQADLEALFAPVPAGAVINYCNTGHTAALNWFVLAEVLGRSDVSLYDGSMTEWTQDPARPVGIMKD